MLILSTVNESIELVTGLIGQVDWTVSWADNTTTTFTPGSSDNTLSVPSTISMIPAPAAATQRQVKLITIINRDSTVTQTITVQKNTSGAKRSLVNSIPLLPNEVLEYIDGQGFLSLSPFAVRKISSSVSFVNTQATPYFVKSGSMEELFQLMLIELRVHSLLVQDMSKNIDDLEQLRTDIRNQL